MNKKILAVALALLFVVTAFTACKSKLEMTKINGKEYPLMTDEDGNTVVNEDNQVAVLVTDEDGDVIKYENGEDQTRWIQLPGSVVVNNAIQDKEYKMIIPEGWTGSSARGRIFKDGTDEKCYMSFAKISEVSEDMNLEIYLESIDEQNEELGPTLEDIGQTLTVDKSEDSIKGINYNKYVYKIVDGNGQVIHYVENYYFTTEKNMYLLTYACEKGIGYDESFEFRGYIIKNFTFKG